MHETSDVRRTGQINFGVEKTVKNKFKEAILDLPKFT
jgi:hypothetical protein